MFIKIWQLIILYIDRMDWRAGHLNTTEGTGDGAFANKNCPQGRAFEIFSNARGMPGGLSEGMLAAGIDSHIIQQYFRKTGPRGRDSRKNMTRGGGGGCPKV